MAALGREPLREKLLYHLHGAALFDWHAAEVDLRSVLCQPRTVQLSGGDLDVFSRSRIGIQKRADSQSGAVEPTEIRRKLVQVAEVDTCRPLRPSVLKALVLGVDDGSH